MARSFFAALFLSLALVSPPAQSGTATGKSSGWLSSGGVEGEHWDPTSTVTITYSTGDVQTTIASSTGHFYVGLPAGVSSGTTFTVTGTEADHTAGNVPGTVADLFRPPSNTVLTQYTVSPGSSMSINGSVVALSGSFASVEKTLDLDSASPSFGE